MTGRFLLFSLPASGSKRLAKALTAHPGLRCFGEPFNPAVADPTGRRTPAPTLAQVDAVLDGVWTDWPVIEHIWKPSGWPFPKHSPHNGHILLRGSRVVLLSRRNLLALAVADAMRKQCASRPEAEDSGPARPLDPLDIAEVRWQLKQMLPTLGTHRRVLYTRDRTRLDMTCEDLFGPELGSEERRSALDRVFAFFDCSIGDPGVDPEVIRACIDAEETDVELEMLHAVPNLEEIDRELGCDETGWLIGKPAG